METHSRWASRRGSNGHDGGGALGKLDAIDEATERTKAAAATERLRDALLHELLTCDVPGWHTAWMRL